MNPINPENVRFVLATSSKYKRQTLEKLKIPFKCISPNIDEAALSQESAKELVERLSVSKAQKALDVDSGKTDTSIYIGIDQVALFGEKIIGKPRTIEDAVAQLTEFSGNSVTFLTGITLSNHKKQSFTHIEPYRVTFRDLTLPQIKNYIKAEMPLDCAGSFKCEGQGILLFEEMKGRDIKSLVGMPLIAFRELCMKFGIDLFALIG